MTDAREGYGAQGRPKVSTREANAVALARLSDRFGQAIQGRLDETGDRPVADVPTRFVIASVVGSILGMMREWLAAEPHAEVPEAALWIWTIARPPSGPAS